jgi:hypothetical protein
MTGLLSVWDVMIGAYRTVISHGLMDSPHFGYFIYGSCPT